MNFGIHQEWHLNVSQVKFDELIDKYSNGLEPLQNWTTEDLIALQTAIDGELMDRAPPDSCF